MIDSRAAPRLAIVVSHPIQYYSPWFRWMAQHHSLDFKVWYLSDFGLRAAPDEKFGKTFAWDTDLTSGYAWEVVPNTSPKPDTLRFGGLRNPALFPRLTADRPAAILLFGYNYHTHLRLIFWARRRNLPLIFRGDSHRLGRDRLPFWKQTLLRLLYRQFAAFTFVGAANRDYFRHAGVPQRKLFFAPHAVDQSLYDPNQADHQAAAVALRASLSLSPQTRVVLFAGKLIPSKQPLVLLDAFIRNRFSNTILVFSGDGPERAQLQAKAADAADRVRFLPFANQSEMPARYAMADLFVLPSDGSYETWGLAVNEAMHLGVPCLVSDRVGCQQDLVTDGQTGWVFRANDPSSLAQKLREALETSDDARQQIKRAIAEQIGQYSYEAATKGLRAAFDFVIST